MSCHVMLRPLARRERIGGKGRGGVEAMNGGHLGGGRAEAGKAGRGCVGFKRALGQNADRDLPPAYDAGAPPHTSW